LPLLSSMQCASAILSSVVCPAVQHFSTLSHKRYDFRKKVTEHKMCVSIFSTTFVWNISHLKKKWARYYWKCISVCMWSTGYCCQIVMRLEFISTGFRKKLILQIWWKSVQWEPSCSMRRDRQTDRQTWRGWLWVFAVLQMLLKLCNFLLFSVVSFFPPFLLSPYNFLSSWASTNDAQTHAHCDVWQCVTIVLVCWYRWYHVIPRTVPSRDVMQPFLQWSIPGYILDSCNLYW